MKAFHCIGGVDHLANRCRVLKEAGQPQPISFPTLHHQWILLPPLVGKISQFLLRSRQISRLIDRRQISHHRLLILRHYVAQRSAHLMNQAQLDISLGKYRLGSITKARQVINRADQQVFYPAPAARPCFVNQSTCLTRNEHFQHPRCRYPTNPYAPVNQPPRYYKRLC